LLVGFVAVGNTVGQGMEEKNKNKNIGGKPQN
jgi:hypothetical protein